MLRSFRRAAKSTVGTAVIGFVGLLIIIGFAAGDISSLSLGGGTLPANDLAKAGSFEVTDRDMSDTMQRRLAQVRQQNPEASYAMLAADFDPLLEALIDQRALQAFAKKHGLTLSKRLIDAEIAQIPGVKGLNGEVSSEGYQRFLSQQRMTDAEVRDLLTGSLLDRLLVTPAASSARVPVGMATPYASMLLEQREGQVAAIPIEPFEARIKPTDAELQRFYTSNRDRYMVPEQRVLKIAPITTDQLAGVVATDQEIQAYYNSHQDVYAPKDVRALKQAVVPDEQAAKGIAARVAGGQSFDEAIKPAGLSATDVDVGAQTRQQFADLAGADVAARVFAAKPGSTVGPIKSDLGWHVVKIESATTRPGKSLAEARGEIAEAITANKRKEAFADLVDKIQDALDGGANFDEAARTAKLAVITTPAVTASGVARADPGYKFPADLAIVLKSGFELAPTDEPVIEQLPDDKGFALVAPAEVVPAAPAPLASIRDRVSADLVRTVAQQQALALARAIAAKASKNVPLAEAVKQAGVPLPAPRPIAARRLQLSQLGANVPAPLKTLFAAPQGSAQVASDPQGNGFYVVKVAKVTPGNALNQPGLITEVQKQFEEPLGAEYAQQFAAAIRKDVGVRRNDAAIEAAKKRITGGGS
jgi:peptidyl-prolyl cis-trans isomerase D